jgi:two-component system, sensor histidine kinase
MGRHVLIVDDDPDTREALLELLQSWGHEVDVAADGCEAITLALERRPEVVLLDIGLPDVDGYEVARRIRSGPGGEACCLIALTGSDEDDDARAVAFDAHILKPADPEVLRVSVERGPAVRVDDAQ